MQLPIFLFFTLLLLPLYIRSLSSFYPNSITATQPFNSNLEPSDLIKISFSFHLRRSYSSLRFPIKTNVTKLCLLLLLAGDVSINPGPSNFAFTNIRSLRNKGDAISEFIDTSSIDILGLTETYISENDTPSFLSELTPDGF